MVAEKYIFPIPIPTSWRPIPIPTLWWPIPTLWWPIPIPTSRRPLRRRDIQSISAAFDKQADFADFLAGLAVFYGGREVYFSDSDSDLMAADSDSDPMVADSDSDFTTAASSSRHTVNFGCVRQASGLCRLLGGIGRLLSDLPTPCRGLPSS